jgi:Fe-S cluster biogenesis protein NfuA
VGATRQAAQAAACQLRHGYHEGDPTIFIREVSTVSWWRRDGAGDEEPTTVAAWGERVMEQGEPVEEQRGGEPLGEDEVARRFAALDEVLSLIRPAVQMDGGDLALVDADVESGIVEVRLEGACGSCAISSATLQGGVERILRERLEWVREVRGGVDDSLDPFESAALGRGAYVPRFE